MHFKLVVYNLKGTEMARTSASRKYLLTINNPLDHGFTHDTIKKLLSEFASVVYWCMCDETGAEGTPHTHIYVIFENAVMFNTIQRKFYGAHIDEAYGSHAENRDYVRKEGKWAESEKKETNDISTFEEFGELPPDRSSAKSTAKEVVDMIVAGASNAEIIAAYPTTYTRTTHIDQTRQILLYEKFKNLKRELEVTYLWGAPGVGKTRSVLEKYGFENVYRVTNYDHPFDEYKGQDVLVLEEFRSGFKIGDLLNYMDIYPIALPCRYNNKVACYTKVYILSNISLEQQYTEIQREQPATWKALLRRIHHVYEMLGDTPDGENPFNS